MFFISRKQCWRYFYTHMKPLLLVAMTVYVIIIPITLVISIFTGGVFLTALPSIIQSCNFIINFINKNMILPHVLKKLFDFVIHEHMNVKYNKLPKGVLNPYLPGFYGETLFGRSVRNIFRICGPVIWISRLLFCFLVNMIPIVGPFLVILIKAPKSGFSKHSRYFHLKGYTNAQIYYIWSHERHQYFFYGVVSLLLESIPIFGYLFIFTNAAGAAYWATDIEIAFNQDMIARMKMNSEKINK